jgi:hypothetical protein
MHCSTLSREQDPTLREANDRRHIYLGNSGRCASTIHIVGRAFHRGHGNRFVVCADERLIAFVEVSGNYNFA